MKATTIAPFGGPVDGVFHKGRIVLAWQSGAGKDVRLVYVEVDPVSHAILLSYSFAIGDDVGAFPRLLSAHDSVWCLYREGASLGGRAVLRRDGKEVWRSQAECGGNDPVALGGTWFAWQQAGSNAVRVSNLMPPYNEVVHRFGAPTGLSRFVGPDVVLVDEDRGAVSGMTRPSWAGELVAGEHPEAGVVIRSTADSRELLAFPGQSGTTPRLAYDPITRLFAVVTWGKGGAVDYGVRLATFTASELQTPAPATLPFPPSRLVKAGDETLIDWQNGGGWKRRDQTWKIEPARFFLGSEFPWARDGMPPGADGASYSHLMQGDRVSAGAVQITKALGSGPRGAVFTFDADGTCGLAFDGTNELEAGYRLVWPGTTQTARLYPRAMTVTPNGATRAERAAHRVEVPVERLDLKTGDRLACVWRGWVEAVYEGPAIGDVPAGLYALIGWSFDFIGDGHDGDPRGFVELTLGHAVDGPVAWRETRVSTGAVRTWYGVRNVERIADPELQFADAAPTAPPPPTQAPPTPTPMPPSTVFPSFVSLAGWRGYLSARDEADPVVPQSPDGVPNGAVWAMPDLRGWERWQLVVLSRSPLLVAFRSVWGHYLCAEAGGGGRVVQRDRQGQPPAAYETFAMTELGGGWVALQASNGQFVVMEADGTVNADRDVMGGWERWKLEAAPAFADPGEVIVTPPPPNGGSTHRGALRRRERVLFDDTGDRLILNTSMFQATTLLEHEPELYADNIAASLEAGIDEWRIGAAVNWPESIQDELPTEPRHVEKIVEAIDRQWAAGIRTDLCLFLAQSDIPELATGSMCEDYTRRVCRALKDRTHAFRITIANEPGDTRVWRLGLEGLRRMRDVVRQELPGVIVGLGAPWHPKSLGTCEWTEGSREDGENALPWFAEGCDTVGPHYSRSTHRRRNARQPWLGRRDSGGTTAVMVDEEPIGPANYYRPDGSLFNQNEQDPDNLGVYATASWMQGHAVYCFHTGAGIGYQRLARVPAYFRLREMPGLLHVGAAKRVLPGNLPGYRFANWGWSLDQGQLFRREYEPSDSDGTPPTRGHCATRGDQFINHEFFGEREYDLIARVAMAFSVWDRQGTTFVQVAEHRIKANERLRMRPCLDRLLIGRLL